MVYNQQNDKPFWIEQALRKASKVKGLKFKHKKGKARQETMKLRWFTTIQIYITAPSNWNILAA